MKKVLFTVAALVTSLVSLNSYAISPMELTHPLYKYSVCNNRGAQLDFAIYNGGKIGIGINPFEESAVVNERINPNQLVSRLKDRLGDDRISFAYMFFAGRHKFFNSDKFMYIQLVQTVSGRQIVIVDTIGSNRGEFWDSANCK